MQCNYKHYAYNTMHVRAFLAAQLISEMFPLPYSLLLDYSTFEFTTLPYPTLPESEKPLPFRACQWHGAGVYYIFGLFVPFATLICNTKMAPTLCRSYHKSL